MSDTIKVTRGEASIDESGDGLILVPYQVVENNGQPLRLLEARNKVIATGVSEVGIRPATADAKEAGRAKANVDLRFSLSAYREHVESQPDPASYKSVIGVGVPESLLI